MSMDQKLSADDYPRNDRGFYVGGLVDPQSMEKFKPCVLTGEGRLSGRVLSTM